MRTKKIVTIGLSVLVGLGVTLHTGQAANTPISVINVNSKLDDSIGLAELTLKNHYDDLIQNTEKSTDGVPMISYKIISSSINEDGSVEFLVDIQYKDIEQLPSIPVTVIKSKNQFKVVDQKYVYDMDKNSNTYNTAQVLNTEGVTIVDSPYSLSSITKSSDSRSNITTQATAIPNSYFIGDIYPGNTTYFVGSKFSTNKNNITIHGYQFIQGSGTDSDLRVAYGIGAVTATGSTVKYGLSNQVVGEHTDQNKGWFSVNVSGVPHGTDRIIYCVNSGGVRAAVSGNAY